MRRALDFYWRDHELLRPPKREQLRMERHNQRVLAATLDDACPTSCRSGTWARCRWAFSRRSSSDRFPRCSWCVDDWLVYGPLLDPWAKAFTRRWMPARTIRRLVGVPTALPDLDRVEAVCFVSESVRRAARDNTRWSFPRSTVTYSGVDRDDFPPPAPEEEAGAWEGRLLYVGRVEGRKGVETAVRALALLPPDHTLEILGRGTEDSIAELRRVGSTAGAGDRVSFGAVDREALRPRYLAADVLVFPSEWEEPFGLVPLEAMACGRPVVATATGGAAEFLLDGVNCLLFPSGDVEALAAAVRRLAADPKLRARLVDGGLRTAAGLTTDRLADVLEHWHARRGLEVRRRPTALSPLSAPPQSCVCHATRWAPSFERRRSRFRAPPCECTRCCTGERRPQQGLVLSPARRGSSPDRANAATTRHRCTAR